MIQPLVIFRRVTFEFSLDVTNAAGVAEDLTGCTARCQIRDKNKALIATPTVTIPTPTNGSVNVLLTDEQTTSLTVGEHVIDVLLDRPDGKVWIILEPEGISIIDTNTQA